MKTNKRFGMILIVGIMLAGTVTLSFTACNKSGGSTSGSSSSGGPTNWTPVADSTFGSSRINAIAYGNNRFVAGGLGGRIAYSANGATWTRVSDSKFGTQIVDIINDIAYGASNFVAVGQGIFGSYGIGRITYSTDGATWGAVVDSKINTGIRGDSTFGEDNGITAIAWGGNRFIAGGTNGKMAYSTDGTTWTAVADSPFPSTNSSGDSYFIAAIAYGNNRFVVVGEEGKMAYSTDGAKWIAVPNNTFNGYDIRGIAYGNGRFVAVGEDGKMAYADW